MTSPNGFRLGPWVPVLVWAAAIFAVSSTPGSALPPLPGLQTDKVIHAAVYAVLGVLNARALGRTSTLSRRTLVASATGLALFYGVTDEIHQLFVPGRMADVADVAADAVGSLTGAFSAASIAARRARRRRD